MKTRLTKWMAAMFLMLTMMLGGTLVAHAEPLMTARHGIYMTPQLVSDNFMINDITSTNDVIKMKSSNKKVATVSKFEDGGHVYLAVHPVKPGKTIVSADVKYQNKVYHLKSTVYVRKYINPLKNFKLAGKDYAKKYNKMDEYSLKKAVKGKISVKLKKGWKLKGVYAYNSTDGSGWTDFTKKKTVSVKKGQELVLYVVYKNSPTKVMNLRLRVD